MHTRRHRPPPAPLPQGVAPALRTYNTLIIACNMCNQPREALAVHQELLAEGCAPNSTTYNALISAYGKLGQLERVLEVRCVLLRVRVGGCGAFVQAAAAPRERLGAPALPRRASTAPLRRPPPPGVQ